MTYRDATLETRKQPNSSFLLLLSLSLSLHENFSLMFYIVAVLHDNTGSSTAEREADGDYGCSALLVALLLGAAPLARSVGCSLSSEQE